MDGPIFELGVGRFVFHTDEYISGPIKTIGLSGKDGALLCLGDVPTGITASLTATWPPELAPGRTEYRTEVLGTGTVIASRDGGCVNFVGVQPSDGTGLDREVLERLRRHRVRLDLRLVIATCECSRKARTAEVALP
ncbi:hypothetical protein GCM10029992_37550 [Glycomyces albus]